MASDRACSLGRPSRAATAGISGAARKQTTLDAAMQTPAHSVARSNSGRFAAGRAEDVTGDGQGEQAPGAGQAEPGGELHPEELAHRDGHHADGVDDLARPRRQAPRLAPVPLKRRHVGGGSSGVRSTVHSTDSRNTTAPTRNEYRTDSGTPFDGLRRDSRVVQHPGQHVGERRAQADEEALHQKAGGRWLSGSLSATKARNGSMLTLTPASSTHSSVAATQSAGDAGMANRTRDAIIAPTVK